MIAEFGTTACAYLIFDNAPSHWNVEEATALGTLPTKRLPKFSPFLNSIENAFSAWKASLKALLSANQHVFLSPNENGREIGQTWCNFRFHRMKEFIEESSRTVTAFKCSQWQNFTTTFHPKCLAMQTID